MKLAEALILRADYQKRMAQLKDRLQRNAKIQEGEEPAENPNHLLKEYDTLTRELTHLIKRINQTNSNTSFDSEQTLSDVLADRDMIALKRQMLSGLVDSASIRQDRFSRSEIKYISTLNVKDLQKELDDLSKQYRELDTKIQELNWKTNVIE